MGKQLSVEISPMVTLREAGALGEDISLLHKGQPAIGIALCEDLSNGSAISVFGLHLQRDCRSDREESLECFPGLLPVWHLRHLWGIDAGDPDRELPPAVLYPQGVAVTDGNHRGGGGGQGGEKGEEQCQALKEVE